MGRMGLGAESTSGPKSDKTAGRISRRVSGVWDRLFREPRSVVLFILAAVLIGGGGRKLRQILRARNAVGKLEAGEATVEEIEASADHGRAALIPLFQLLGESSNDERRTAAGHALSVIWARDEMIGEEEKALLRRGYKVDWKARRRYPRGLRSEIPVTQGDG
jgi:hypothetical protein